MRGELSIMASKASEVIRNSELGTMDRRTREEFLRDVDEQKCRQGLKLALLTGLHLQASLTLSISFSFPIFVNFLSHVRRERVCSAQPVSNEEKQMIQHCGY